MFEQSSFLRELGLWPNKLVQEKGDTQLTVKSKVLVESTTRNTIIK
jgi:hypothetical protein